MGVGVGVGVRAMGRGAVGEETGRHRAWGGHSRGGQGAQNLEGVNQGCHHLTSPLGPRVPTWPFSDFCLLPPFFPLVTRSCWGAGTSFGVGLRFKSQL